MEVTIHVFAYLRERLGATLTVDLPAETTIAALKEAVSARDLLVADTVASSRVAINQEFINGPAIKLHPSDELALIPPVSGG